MIYILDNQRITSNNEVKILINSNRTSDSIAEIMVALDYLLDDQENAVSQSAEEAQSEILKKGFGIEILNKDNLPDGELDWVLENVEHNKSQSRQHYKSASGIFCYINIQQERNQRMQLPEKK